MNFCWAKSYPDIFNICCRFKLTKLCNPQDFCYTSLQPMLQDGPTCGLVALAITMKSASRETVDSLLSQAKEFGYTFNGEIFSGCYMHNLATKNLNNDIELYCGHINNDYIRNFLLKGGLMLVPYDCDKNHTPALLNGHKAHWAVIVGAVKTDESFYVLGRHGKSKNVAVWLLSELADSNAQLTDIAPDRKYSDMEYKLPEGGLAGVDGLQKRTVLVYPLLS